MSAVLLPSPPAQTSELPGGLLIKRQGEACRRYLSAKGGSSLLTRAGESDLILGTLHRGESLFIAPRIRGYVEIYFVIEGRLELKTDSERRTLGKNAHIASDELTDSAQLTACTETRYIYFSTELPDNRGKTDTKPVVANDGSFDLRFSNGRVELVRGSVKANKDIFFSPFSDEHFGTKEVYYLLKGQLWHQYGSKMLMLEAGDYVITDNLEASVRFIASEEVEYLYFSGAPAFQDIRFDHDDLMRLAVEIEQKDGYTAEHCTRIRQLCAKTAELLELPDSSLLALSRAAFLHDVGKTKVPLSILRKPGKLNTEEWAVIKQHPTFGKEIVASSRLFDALSKVGMIIEQHHEREDGSGYPFGLQREQILLESYILAVADTYDAMTTDRPYRKALPEKEAFREIRSLAGVHYPDRVVNAFIAANQFENKL